MKSTITILNFFICACTFAQVQPLNSKVYNGLGSSSASHLNGSTKIIFRGSGAVLSVHEVNTNTLLKGRSITYNKRDKVYERFFIIKSGAVTVTLNHKTAVLDRGSVVSVLPGDKINIKNTGQTDAQYYEIKYQSIAPADVERGRKAGGSFMLNWNDITFEPTDKGGVRQFFDRPTAMLNRFDIHVTQLNEGFKSHDPHTHKNEEIILMMEGNAEMQIGTDHQKANAGDVVLLGSNVLHNLTNVGKTPCLYFAIQWN